MELQENKSMLIMMFEHFANRFISINFVVLLFKKYNTFKMLNDSNSKESRATKEIVTETKSGIMYLIPIVFAT